MHARDGIEPLGVGQVEIEEDDIEALVANELQPAGEPLRMANLESIATALGQVLLKQASVPGIVLDQ